MKYASILALWVIILLLGCDSVNSSNNSLSVSDNSTTPVAATEIKEEPKQHKQVDWKDGNTYSYDYIESIETKDSLGNLITISIYKQNKPSEDDVACDVKTCKWCGRQVQADSYKIEEYPNINAFRDKADLASAIDLMFNTFLGFLQPSYMNYFDLENNKIRTEWKTVCNYPGPDGFCSLKCKSEYRNDGY